MARQTASPSISGIPQFKRITSGCSARAISNPNPAIGRGEEPITFILEEVGQRIDRRGVVIHHEESNVADRRAGHLCAQGRSASTSRSHALLGKLNRHSLSRSDDFE